MGLSNKQRIFVAEYLKCWNASEAAKRAGYKGKANVVGPRLLANVSIQEEIKSRLKESVMEANEALSRLAEQARCAYSAYIQADGTVDLAQMKADGMMHLIAGIKPTKHGNEVKFYDGQTALVTIARHHGLLTERVDVTSGGERLRVVLKWTDDGSNLAPSSSETEGSS